MAIEEGLIERVVKEFSDTPVITWGLRPLSVFLETIRKGAYDYIPLPFERDQLLVVIRRALECHRLKSDLEKTYDITLECLGDALAMRDAETGGHSKRVTAYAVTIARKMGLLKEEINVIARAAFLHDIGKIAIPDDILGKPGKLTDEEMGMMKEHCYLGYKTVSRIPFLAEAADIVYSHHERYDGTGYPRGLKGKEIPLGARLVAVANILDSITSDLSYRPAQTFEAARKEIELWSGRQFDPIIVKTFLEVPDHIWEDMRKGITKGA